MSIVYKSGSYWAYHTRTLYKPDGEMDDKYNHFEQAWQIVRLQNYRSKKLVTAEDIQNRNHKRKENEDSLKVETGDIIKFGRVRFRVKKLVISKADNALPGDKNMPPSLAIDSIRDR